MASPADRAARFRVGPLLGLVIVTASLYLAREVIIPLALALLFSFLLSPAVRRMESWRLGRTPATLIVVALGTAILIGVGWVAANQVVSLAGKLPEYKDHIVHKLRALHSMPQGELGKAAKAIEEIQKETDGKDEAARRPAKAPARKATPAAEPATPFSLVKDLGLSILTVVGMTLAVFVMTCLMLLRRDDLRDRVMRLIGSSQVRITTQAMEDAADRVTRYLLMQLVVNTCYGIPLGIALFVIGIPNALLFGLLATVLRFIPYLGAAIAAGLPIALAFAISDGWSTIAWTVGVIATLEFIVANVIEPWLYGASTGLSPIAVVFSAFFWTWLWGPIGLLLSTPIAVCLSVAGRHVPQFGFLNVILGVEPVLEPEVRLYQRLVAQEYDEALDMAEAHAKEHGTESLYEAVMLPALLMAKRDRMSAALDEAHERFVFEALQRIVDEIQPIKGSEQLTENESGASGQAVQKPSLCVVPAHDDADYIAASMLSQLLAAEHFALHLLPHSLLAAELLERLDALGGEAILISAVPPSTVANAAYLCKRLRARFPGRKIAVALWRAETNVEQLAARLKAAGADEVVTRLAEALERVRLLVPH